MRLIVDDERTFQMDGTYVRTSKDAIAMLCTGTWDEVWLDHDLGGEDTTMPVVDLLSRESFLYGDKNPHKDTVIYVHSQNPVGVDTIVRTLTRYGYDVRRTALPQ